MNTISITLLGALLAFSAGNLPVQDPVLKQESLPQLRGLRLQQPELKLRPGILNPDTLEAAPSSPVLTPAFDEKVVTIDRQLLSLDQPVLGAWLQSSTFQVLDIESAELSVAPGSNVILATAEGAKTERRADGLHVMLPYMIRHVDAAGSVTEVGRPEMQPLRESLGWNAVSANFECIVRVGIVAAGPSRALANPVTFLLSSSADLLQPTEVSIASTNEFRSVRLVDSGVRDEVDFSLLPLGMPPSVEPPALLLPVERPRIELSATPSSLLGFGLQTAKVSVRTGGAVAVAPDRREVRAIAASFTPAAALRAFEVVLAVERGSLDDSALVLGPSVASWTTLRSASLGTDTLRVAGAPFQAAELKLRYRFPTLFCLAALLGGVCGAIAAVRLRMHRAPGLKDLVAAAATGLLAAVSYAAGVNLIGLDFGSGVHESLVFTIAAVAGIIGLPALPGMGGDPEPATT